MTRLFCVLIVILCQLIDVIHSEQIDDIIYNKDGQVIVNDSLNAVHNDSRFSPHFLNNLQDDLIDDPINDDQIIRYQREFLKQDLIQLLFKQIDKHETECSRSLNDFKLNLNNGSTWAFKLYDSSSRQITGLLDGTFLNLGNFEQCIHTETESKGFIGKYFLINLVPSVLDHKYEGLSAQEFKDSNLNLKRRLSFLFRFPEQVNVKVGLCLPRQCENNEIQQLLNRTINPYYWKIYRQINSQVNENIWSKLESSSVHVKVAFCIIASLLSLVLISTILDLNLKPKKGQNSILQSLVEPSSIKANFQKLHSDDTTGHKNDFVAKNRYYSEIIVNVTHVIVFVPILGGSVINENIFDWLNLTNKFYFQFFFTDCYFPGLLLLASTSCSLKMYSLIQKQATGRELIENALRRMVSFWPILIVLISIQICMPLFIRGPLVKELLSPLAISCERYWILNLLFINNLIPMQHTCLPYTWTISCEMQLYLLISLLTFFYIKKPKFAHHLNVLFIAIGLFANIYVSYKGLTKPNVIFLPFNYQAFKDSIYYSHLNTLVQFFPYFTLFLAFMRRLNKKSLKISIEIESLITVVLFLYLISAGNSSIVFNVLGLKPSPIVNTIYFLYNRMALPALISWLVLQYWPNGEPSKKEKIKEWLNNLLGKLGRRQKKGRSGDAIEKSSQNLNKTLHINKDNTDVKDAKSKLVCLVQKVSSSESTSDLSDHLNDPIIESAHLSVNQETNNNSTACNLEKEKLVDLPEQMDKKFAEQKSTKNTIIGRDEMDVKRSKHNKRLDTMKVWVKLSRSIYYSHFFYLMYSLFNVNNAQKSDIFSMVISIHSKLFWTYILAYVFHLLIEGAVTNLTTKLIELLFTKKKLHKN